MKAKRIMIAALIAVLTVFICMPQVVVFGWDPEPINADPEPINTDPEQCTLSMVAGTHIQSTGVFNPDNQLVPIMILNVGDQAKITSVPMTGYHFKQYEINGTAPAMDVTKPDQTITVYGSVVLTAKAEANTYSVRFEANGGEGSMKDQSMTYDVEAALSSNTFVREHYYFNGWNTKKDGTGTAYKNKQKVKNLSAEQGDVVTLYAQWKKKPTYKVTYNLNGGKMDSKTGTVSNKYEEGQIITLPKPSRKGYKFRYWVGTDGDEFDAGEKIEVESNLKFTASWKANSNNNNNNNNNKKKSNNNSNNNSSNNKSSKTGDSRHQTIPFLLMLISATVMAMAVAGIKKSR